MPAVIVIGMSFGDSGKGKITDFLSKDADMVVRFGGGNNAGHTVVVGEEEYKLHLIPSGILHKNVDCVLGNGVVISLRDMVQEINDLAKRGISTERLYISNRAHVILPTHIERDKSSEGKLKNKIGIAGIGTGPIGTTCKGIGPTYTDKVGRIGIRVGDLASSQLQVENLIRQNYESSGVSYSNAYVLSLELRDCWSRLQRHIVDSSFIINKAIDANKRVLFEGAQGLLIDVDHGTYPFVTSSNPSAGGVCTGAGVGPTKIKHTIGVVKAYATRVGEGPFPTELHDSIGEDIRRRGNEFGTTTGRPRRCGWIDVVALKYAAMVNGVDSIAITKLDILDGMDEIKICYAYELDGKTLDYFPSTCDELNRVKPVYGTVPGWSSSISNITDWSLLPVEARSYICSITSALGVPAMIIGTGPGRDKIIGGEGFWESVCFDKSSWSW